MNRLWKDESEITRKLNEIYKHEELSPYPVLTKLQFATLDREDWCPCEATLLRFSKRKS